MKVATLPLASIAVLLSGCGVGNEGDEIVERKHFAVWRCDAKAAPELASALATFADRHVATVDVGAITAGGQGSVVQLARSDDGDGGVEVLFPIINGARTVTVYANRRGKASEGDREFAEAALAAAELNNCQSVG